MAFCSFTRTIFYFMSLLLKIKLQYWLLCKTWTALKWLLLTQNKTEQNTCTYCSCGIYGVVPVILLWVTRWYFSKATVKMSAIFFDGNLYCNWWWSMYTETLCLFFIAWSLELLLDYLTTNGNLLLFVVGEIVLYLNGTFNLSNSVRFVNKHLLELMGKLAESWCSILFHLINSCTF